MMAQKDTKMCNKYWTQFQNKQKIAHHLRKCHQLAHQTDFYNKILNPDVSQFTLYYRGFRRSYQIYCKIKQSQIWSLHFSFPLLKFKSPSQNVPLLQKKK